MKPRMVWSLILSFALATGLLGWLTPSAQSGGSRAPATTRCVNVGGTSGCYASIQAAINDLTYGDSINVWAGTYAEHITMKNGVSVYGDGWTTTIIDGGYSGQSTVYIPSGISASTVLSGVKVIGGGSGDPNTSTPGGGIYIQDASPTISNTWVYSSTGNAGGGIYVFRGSPTLNNVAVWNSRANTGGGLYFNNTTVTMTGDLFAYTGTVYGNSAIDGGGIYMTGVTATLGGLHISGNTAQGYGGGVRIVNSPNPVSLQWNEIAQNTSFGGAGVSADQATNLQIVNNWINSNLAIGTGGGAYFSGSGGLYKGNFMSGNAVASGGNVGGGVTVGQTSTVTLEGNWLEFNTAPNSGGGVSVGGGSSILLNANVFITNTANEGGGVSVNSTGIVTLTNNIAAHNSAAHTYGGGFYVRGAGHRVVNNTVADNVGSGITFELANGIQIQNNIVYGNFAGGLERLGSTSYNADYNDVAANTVNYVSVGAGTHDKAYDPLFIGTGNRFIYYHLQATSPVGKTGSLTYAPLYDIDGERRAVCTSMGADQICSKNLSLPLIVR